MKRALIIIIVLIIIAAIVGFIFYYTREDNSKELTLYGNVDVRQVDISFRVNGQVDELFVEEGDFVKRGDLLAKLENDPYDSEVIRATAHLEAIKASLKNSELLVARRAQLIGIGGVSEEDLDNTISRRDELRSELQAAEASLIIAMEHLEQTRAYAPNDGIIFSRVREPGSVVKESEPVYTLSLIDPIWIRAFVAEPHLGQVKYGMKAKITTDTPHGKSYEGTVGFISPLAEFTPKTVETTELRTDLVYRLRIYVNQPAPGLKQGMPVTVHLSLEEPGE